MPGGFSQEIGVQDNSLLKMPNHSGLLYIVEVPFMISCRQGKAH